MSNSPYKLFDYYTYEDRHLFFGREEESLRMVGEILSTRLLVLFAPSGSGKSSLINAGVRPLLEDRGFRTVYVRMETDPATSIRQASARMPALGAGLPTPPEPPTEGLPESGRPTVEEVARSETGHSAGSETGHEAPPELRQPSPRLPACTNSCGKHSSPKTKTTPSARWSFSSTNSRSSSPSTVTSLRCGRTSSASWPRSGTTPRCRCSSCSRCGTTISSI